MRLNLTILWFPVKRFTLFIYELLKSSTEGEDMIIKRKKHKLLMGNFRYVCSEMRATQNYREICLRNIYIYINITNPRFD